MGGGSGQHHRGVHHGCYAVDRQITKGMIGVARKRKARSVCWSQKGCPSCRARQWRRRESNPHPGDATAVCSRYTTSPGPKSATIISAAGQKSSNVSLLSAKSPTTAFDRNQKTTPRRGTDAQRSENDSRLSYPASLRLCAGRIPLVFNDLRCVPPEILVSPSEFPFLEADDAIQGLAPVLLWWIGGIAESHEFDNHHIIRDADHGLDLVGVKRADPAGGQA